MIEGLIEAGHNPALVLPSLDDDSSEEDSRPLRIKRRVAPLPEKSHGKEIELGRPLRRLRRRGVSSFKRSHASSCKMQGSDAVFSKKSHGNVKEEQDGQPQPNMQQNDAFLADKLSGTGPYTFVPYYDVIYEDREASPPLDDEELFDHLGLGRFCINFDRPHIHQIFVHADYREESGFVKLLEAIKCGDRFVACSVDTRAMCYAKLDHEEAAKLRGVDGVNDVVSCRDLFWAC